MARILKKTLFAVFLAAAAWALLEIILFIAEPWVSRGFYIYDPDLGFRVRPNTPVSNEYGFNDRDYPAVKEPGTFRILFVGDSFSWKNGLTGNYTAILERLFEDHFGAHRVDVINAGYPMTDTREQLAMLRKFDLPYRPDLVVLGFFCGNDIVDAVPQRRRIVVNDLPIMLYRRERTWCGRPLIWKSRLIYFAQQKWRVWQALRRGERESLKRMPQQPTHVGVMPRDIFLNYEVERLQFFSPGFCAQKPIARRFQFALKQVKRMRDFAAEHDADFAVALYPDEIQIVPELFQEVVSRYLLKAEDYDLDYIQRWMSERLAEERIPVLDLLPDFRAGGATSTLYSLQNTHWNEAGNERAANRLFEWLLPVAEEGLRKAAP